MMAVIGLVLLTGLGVSGGRPRRFVETVVAEAEDIFTLSAHDEGRTDRVPDYCNP